MTTEQPGGGGRGPSPVNRRGFLRQVGVGAAAVATASAVGLPAFERTATAQEVDALEKATSPKKRRKLAYKQRIDAANLARSRPQPTNVANGDETAVANYAAMYSKAMPHNALGEPDVDAYQKLLVAVDSGSPTDFAAVPVAGAAKLENPQAALAFDLMGSDSHALFMPAAPAFASARQAAEMAELYWAALLRDVPFEDFASSAEVAAAADDLSGFSDYAAPKEGGRVTPSVIFRGDLPGDLDGPFLSQFLVRDIPRWGAQNISAKIRTAAAGADYMTDFASWLNVQNGGAPVAAQFDATPRYLRNLRDLAEYARIDVLFQPYLSALMLLTPAAMRAPVDPGLPPRSSSNQSGFVEFGVPHFLSLLGEVSVRALRAVWYQKWMVHRRIRPEEFGGRVHNKVTGAADYPLHQELLDSASIDAVFDKYGTYLLPMAAAEGSPTHPSYASGHAAIAGAAVTILKAMFDESFVIPNPVVPDRDGLSLVPYTGGELTLGRELNKLASNMSIGRNVLGVHWHSDYLEGVRLGEAVAIALLEEQKACHNQDFTMSLTKFDGTAVTV